VNGPIFIGGDDRSGTTLLSLILDSHAQLTIGPELDFLLPANLGPCILECCDLLARADERVSGSGVDTRDPLFQPGVQFVRQCQRFGIEAAELARLVECEIRSAGDEIVSFAARCGLIDRIGKFRRAQRRRLRWGIKIQRSIVRAPEFAAFWRGAQFVHMVRDGRDVAASHLRGHRPWGYRDIREAARGWVEVVECEELRLPGLPVWMIRYEDLVLRPEPELRALLEFLGLPWDDAVLRHAEIGHTLLENPFDHPSAECAGQPIHPGAIARFRRDLSPDETAVFEAIAGPALARLGYRVTTPAGAKAVASAEPAHRRTATAGRSGKIP
jgi:hypothetical protein